jgi:sugar lactone lactonase YvrE
VLAIPGHVYVADAGGNLLDEVFPDGSIQAMAYFPDEIIRDAIPTCVAQGPDGALYVGTLALVDSFQTPHAKVWRVDPATVNTSDPTLTPITLWASGLYPINGCTFGPDGNFYASELFTNSFFMNPQGDVVKIPFADPATHTFLTDGALGYAGGIAAAPNGDIFVADGHGRETNARIVEDPRPLVLVGSENLESICVHEDKGQLELTAVSRRRTRGRDDFLSSLRRPRVGVAAPTL